MSIFVVIGASITLYLSNEFRRTTKKQGEEHFDRQIYTRGQQIKKTTDYQRKLKPTKNVNVAARNKTWVINNASLIKQIQDELGVTLPQELDKFSRDLLKAVNEDNPDTEVQLHVKNCVDTVVNELERDLKQLKDAKARRFGCFRKGIQIRFCTVTDSSQVPNERHHTFAFRQALQDAEVVVSLISGLITVTLAFMQ